MNYDVAVVGGGLVGSTLAAALGCDGSRVVLLDAGPGPAALPTDGWALRVSAISVASARILASVDAWRRLPPGRTGTIGEMRVWDAGGRGAVHFDAADVGLPALGHVLENDALHAALDTRLRELPNVRVHRPARVESLDVGPARAVLGVEGARLRAALVIGADGSRSHIRELAGIEHDGGEFEQHAVVANVRTAIAHRDTAFQRFLPDGPIAFLPLPGGTSSVVWSTAPEHARALLEADAASFAEALADALEQRLGAVEVIGPRAAFPLAHLHAREYVRERVALVGDAAHTVHPLAGQGVNLGILDAAALAEVVAGAAARRRDIGRRAVLRRYERWRRGHNALMGAALRGFKWAFGSRLEPVRLARNAGFAATDALVPVKRAFMRYACGLGGDLPARARASIAEEADL